MLQNSVIWIALCRGFKKSYQSKKFQKHGPNTVLSRKDVTYQMRGNLQQTLGDSCNYQEKLASFSACHIGSNTWRISGGCQYDWLT